MLTLTHRFHGHTSLRPIYQRGKAVYSRNFKLLYASSHGSFRVAVVVSKKVHKSAVVRNRIRRRVYAVVAERYRGETPQHDLIIIGQNAVSATMSPDDFRQEVNTLLDKIA